MIRLPRLAHRPLSAIAAVVLVLGGAACGSKAAATKSYQDTAESFEVFANDLIHTVKADKEGDFKAMAKDLVLPDPKGWFPKVFGDEAGARLLAEYEASPMRDFSKGFGDLRKLIVEQKRDTIATSRHTSPDDEMATGHQVNALRAMKQPVALYRIQLTRADGEKSFTLWSFVHEGDKFRFIGKTKKSKPADPDAKMAREVDMLGELPMKRARELMKEQSDKLEK